ncbi:RICIN domain-containing protein [Spongiactinospora sp. 9N601]|uniref:RICIN domain-containing protein n=1 Tax=Spongiactinospora sp. 9N601 TaxID=3375149 RepID=UPI0037AE0BDC
MAMKILSRLFASLIVMVSVVSLTTVPAHAAPGGWVRIQHFGPTSNPCCDGRYLQIWKVGAGFSYESSSRRFQFINKGNGYEIVQDDPVWTCLDGNNSGGAYGHACNSGNYQRWDIIPAGTRYSFDASRNVEVFRLRNRQTGACLDGNGRRVYSGGCNGGDYQLWGGW